MSTPYLRRLRGLRGIVDIPESLIEPARGLAVNQDNGCLCRRVWDDSTITGSTLFESGRISSHSSTFGLIRFVNCRLYFGDIKIALQEEIDKVNP
jgi:hypothetical protein